MSDEGGRTLLLAIDTANERCSAALIDMADATIFASADPRIGKGHAELLIDTIGAVLRAAGAAWADVGKLAIGIGPGSFTGIRVAVAAARGLELSLGVRSVGVDTLEAQAEPHWDDGPVLAVHDARRGEVYAALYEAGGRVMAAPQAMTPGGLADFRAGHAAARDAGLRVVGTGAAIARGELPDARLVPDALESSSPIAAIARIGRTRVPGAPPLPLYLRGADAKAQISPGLRAEASRERSGGAIVG